MNEERFAHALDAVVNGDNMPDPEPLATFARALQAAEGTDRLDADRRAAIWRQLMTGHAQHHSTTGGPGPVSQPAMTLPANPGVRRSGFGSRRNGIVPYTGRFQTALTAFAVVTIILAAWSGFSSFRETGSPSITPTALAHGAASATPGDPSLSDNEWTTFITLDECTAEPMSREDYASLISQPRGWPERGYTPLGTIDRTDAEAVARAAREHEACQFGGTLHVMETERYVYENSSAAFHPLPQNERTISEMERGIALSEQYPNQNPATLALVTSHAPPKGTVFGEPVPGLPRFSPVYLPEHVIQLSDGRLAIPRAIMYSSADILAPSAEEIAGYSRFATYLMVFSNESGSWLLDERLPFCIGDCTELWNRHLADLGVPADDATPMATPFASPDATPED